MGTLIDASKPSNETEDTHKQGQSVGLKRTADKSNNNKQVKKAKAVVITERTTVYEREREEGPQDIGLGSQNRPMFPRPFDYPNRKSTIYLPNEVETREKQRTIHTDLVTPRTSLGTNVLSYQREDYDDYYEDAEEAGVKCRKRLLTMATNSQSVVIANNDDNEYTICTNTANNDVNEYTICINTVGYNGNAYTRCTDAASNDSNEFTIY